MHGNAGKSSNAKKSSNAWQFREVVMYGNTGNSNARKSTNAWSSREERERAIMHGHPGNV